MRKAAWIFVVLLGMLVPSGAFSASYVEGEALVVFKKSPGGTVTAASVERGFESFRLGSLAAGSGARVAKAYGALSEVGEGIFALLRSDTKTTGQLLEDLKARPDVIVASPNRITRALKLPNDPQYSQLWGLDAIRAPEAWDVTTGSAEVYVAVADTGIYATHPDLNTNLAASYCRDFSGSLTGYSDGEGHGTHVAGTIGAVGNNGLGVAGVNWTTRMIVLKVLNDHGVGTSEWEINALNYLTGLLRSNPSMRIAAVNFSLGGYSSDTPEQTRRDNASWWAYKILDSLNRTVIVVAAGNEGLEVGQPAPYDDPDWPQLLPEPRFMEGEYCYPASFIDLDNMIVVGAAASDDTAASFSNWSPTAVHLTAPGVDIFSTMPQQADRRFYDWSSGTSMAVPHVTGAVALLASRYPNATASQIKAALLRGANAARNPVAKTPANRMGAKLSRHGYLDVKKALEVLKEILSQPEDPKPKPRPKPDWPVSSDAIVPENPFQWEVVCDTPDVQGNIPVTIKVVMKTSKPLISIRAEAVGMSGLTADRYGEGSALLSDFVSAASRDYKLRIRGTVINGKWSSAAIKSLQYRLEGDNGETVLHLGKDGNGIPLSQMSNQTPLLPDPEPRRNIKSSSGCDSGFSPLALALAAFLFLSSHRRRRA